MNTPTIIYKTDGSFYSNDFGQSKSFREQLDEQLMWVKRDEDKTPCHCEACVMMYVLMTMNEKESKK